MSTQTDTNPSAATTATTGTFRGEILTASKRFKARWTELGALLVRVRKEAAYEQWGHATFESYCLRELHIRRQTALKLTNSYAFLERHERGLLDRPQEERPAFEVVEVLAKAEERGQLSEAEYQSIRDEIWNDDRPAAKIAKDLAQKFPAPAPMAPATAVQLRRFASTARRFSAELQRSRKVPGTIGERAASLADDLEELADAQAEASHG